VFKINDDKSLITVLDGMTNSENYLFNYIKYFLLIKFCEVPAIRKISTVQPTLFLIAQNVVGIDGSSSPMHILMGFSTKSDFYACIISNLNTDDYDSYDYWRGSPATSEIISFVYLSGSGVLMVQYGEDLKTPSTTRFSLVFYDLTNLEYDEDSDTNFSLKNMLDSPILQTKLSKIKTFSDYFFRSCRLIEILLLHFFENR
jgi:hypothetical protein